MGVEVVSTDKLEQSVLASLDRLLSPASADATEAEVAASRELSSGLRNELRTLHSNMLADGMASLDGNSTVADDLESEDLRFFASLIVAGVSRTLKLDIDLTHALLQSSSGTLDARQRSSESIVALDRTSSQARFNTSGWDGRSWQSTAGQTHIHIKNSYVEFLGDTKDVLLDFLADGIKDLLAKPMYDGIIAQVKTVLTLILGHELVALLSQTPHLLFLLGFTLLFLLRRSQSNDINVPDDCACVWERIRRINEATGVVRPSDVISTYRRQGSLHPRPFNLAPCEQPSLRRIAKCPFRYLDTQGKDCCRLAYEGDDSFYGETRDYKVLRTFYKLVNLGLLQTRIDRRPDEYMLA